MGIVDTNETCIWFTATADCPLSGEPLQWDSSTNTSVSFTIADGETLCIVLFVNDDQGESAFNEAISQLQYVCIEKTTIPTSLYHGEWSLTQRANGNLGLMWKGATS